MHNNVQCAWDCGYLNFLLLSCNFSWTSISEVKLKDQLKDFIKKHKDSAELRFEARYISPLPETRASSHVYTKLTL